MTRILAQLIPSLGAAAAFSLALNLLILASPLYMLQVYDRVLTSRSVETLIVLTAITVAALGAMSWLDAIRSQLLARVGVRLESAAAPTVLRRSLVAQRAGRTDAAGSFRDLRVLRSWFSGHGVVTLFDMPWSPIYLLLIAMFHPWLGALALVGVLLLLVIAVVDDLCGRRSVERASEAAQRASAFTDLAGRHVDVVHSMGMIRAVEHRWRELNAASVEPALRAAGRSQRMLATSKFMRQALQTAMLGLGAWLVVKQLVSPGAMIAATIILARAMAPIEMAISGWRATIEARAAWRRLHGMLATDDRPPTMPLPAPHGALNVDRLFYGSDPSAPILRGVSFSLDAGDLLGLIGPSGAGKSTLGRLLVGIGLPAAGAVRLDGAELGAWDSDALGPHLGYLPQDVKLFDATVAENIARLGDPTVHADAIVAAARRAGAHEMILRLPQGYETEVGSDGQRLSSGQRQLIGLARAVYGRPALVVLDEPNANLDADGEFALMEALRALRADSITVIVITHRPTVLRDATKMLVLRAGTVADFGPREVVLAKHTRNVVPGSAAVRAAEGVPA